MGFLDKFFKKKSADIEIQALTHDNSENQSLETFKEDQYKFILDMDDAEKEKMIDMLVKNECPVDELYLTKRDNEFDKAARLVVQYQQGSTSLIQRKLSLGYNRAGRIVDQLELVGILGPFDDSKERDVLIKNEMILEHILKSIDNGNFKSKRELFYEKHKELIDSRRAECIKNQQIEKDRLEKEAIKQQMLEKERKKRLHKEALQELIEAGEIFNQFTNKEGKREQIPQDVMDKVWNRDGGRCINCGSQENLEFDHLIPVSKGGATTYRNIQLLCKKCNIEKSNKIG